MEPRAQRHPIDAQFRCRLAFGIVGFLGVPGQRLENFFRAHSRSLKLSERVESTRLNSLAVEV